MCVVVFRRVIRTLSQAGCTFRPDLRLLSTSPHFPFSSLNVTVGKSTQVIPQISIISLWYMIVFVPEMSGQIADTQTPRQLTAGVPDGAHAVAYTAGSPESALPPRFLSFSSYV